MTSSEPIRLPRDYNLCPVRTGADSNTYDAIQISTSGDFTMTEAMDLALSIMDMVRKYGGKIIVSEA